MGHRASGIGPRRPAQGMGHISIDNRATLDTALPFPYPKIIDRAIGCDDRQYGY
jgi:hypothetical protein